MAINTTTVETNLTTKLNATSGTTDAKEFLLLGKAVEALQPSVTVSSVQTEGTTQVSNVTTAGTTQVGLVNTAGTTQVAAVNAAGSSFAPLAGATFTGAIDMGSNNITTTGKILYSNVYSALGDLPSASTYHGMFAHVHGTGKGYYAHAGAWLPLVNEDSSGNVTIGGNLTVSGTTTTVNSTTLDVADKNITVANGAADAAAANGAGLTVAGASATLTYASATDNWNFNKGLAVSGPLNIEEVKEKVIVDTTTSGNIYGNLSLGAVRYYTANQTANRSISFRGDQGSGISLDSIMAVGDSMTSAFLITQGSTAYYINAVYIDGGAPAVLKWVGGAPSAGTASAIDSYTFTIIKTASGTFTVIANLAAYA